MNDQMPMFDDPPPIVAPDAPKKPRRKPVKRRKTRKGVVKPELPPAAPVPKRRVMRKPRAVSHAGSRYTRAQYQAIATLMEMSAKERMAVLEIVKGLTK